jgi:stage IV sporulation protein FB
MQLAFRLGAVPVRIHPSFFIMSLVLGASTLQARPILAAEWLGVVLVSVLVHELGHAWMARAFGMAPEIDLHSMGGTTSWRSGAKMSAGRRVLIALAGPGTGMIAGGIVIALALRAGYPIGGRVPTDAPMIQHVIKDMVWVNIGWGIFNLLPMLPLDGGNAMHGLLDGVTRGKGEVSARVVSILVALGVGGLAIATGNWWPALLAGMFAFQNGRAMYDRSLVQQDAPFRKDLDAAYEALRREDDARVLSLVQPALAGAKAPATRAEAVHLAAYAHLLGGRVDQADAAMGGLPSGYQPSAEYLDLRNRIAAAMGAR